MTKYALTYKQRKNREVVDKAIADACQTCYKQSSASMAAWTLLHVIAYSSLFLVPEHLLYDGIKFSIEDICSYQEGLVNSVSLHDFLERVGAMEVGDTKALLKILLDATLPEVISVLNAPVFDVYCALCAAYFLETGNARKYTEIVSASETTGINKYQRCYNTLTS